MKEIKRLIKESFDLWIKMRWLKEVNKAADKYIKTKEKVDKRYKRDQEKLNRYAHVATTMIQEYKDRYGIGDIN